MDPEYGREALLNGKGTLTLRKADRQNCWASKLSEDARIAGEKNEKSWEDADDGHVTCILSYCLLGQSRPSLGTGTEVFANADHPIIVNMYSHYISYPSLTNPKMHRSVYRIKPLQSESSQSIT